MLYIQRIYFSTKAFFILRRLDFMFISKNPQDFGNHDKDTDSHFNRSFYCTLLSFKRKRCLRGKGIWKFNSSLSKDQNYIVEIKKMIHSFCTANKSLSNHQLKVELLEYEVQKFTMNYMKHIAKKNRNKEQI